jgi:hypothetical protein
MAVDVMLRMKRLRSLWVVVPVLFGIAAVAVAAEMNFPFDQELLLDTAPMRGSKRVPSIEVRSNGVAAIDLWCATGQGSVRLEGTSISIVPYSMQQPVCPPDRRANRSAGAALSHEHQLA